MQPDSAPMHTTGCPHSLPESATEFLPQGLTRKQVCFNLTEDLGDTLPSPADLAHFLGDDTDEWMYGLCPPALSAMSSPRPPSNGDNQCHGTPMGGSWPKTSTAASSKLTAASWARSRCLVSPDLMASPIDWV